MIRPSSSLPAYAIPRWRQARLPILAGSLRGNFWLPASGGKLLRVMLGSYEREQTRMFEELVQPGTVVYDVGAAVGYYTLLAARLVGRNGHVVSFEPDPKNAAFLRQHVAVNSLENVTVHESAVGNTNGRMRFAHGTGTGTGHISDQGGLEVKIQRLDDFVASRKKPPTHVKIDVEGAELQVLDGARTILTTARPTLFLSTHGKPVHDACCEYLWALNYELKPILGNDLSNASEVLCCPQ